MAAEVWSSAVNAGADLAGPLTLQGEARTRSVLEQRLVRWSGSPALSGYGSLTAPFRTRPKATDRSRTVAADITFQAGAAKHLLVEGCFCDDANVEGDQERELRQWAIALSDAAEPERRAMGRAMLMLFEQVDSLHADLQRRPPAPEPHQLLPAVDGAATIEVDADATPVEDTRVLGLRDRLRAATRRGRD
jgi:hypothetical protein